MVPKQMSGGRSSLPTLVWRRDESGRKKPPRKEMTNLASLMGLVNLLLIVFFARVIIPLAYQFQFNLLESFRKSLRDKKLKDKHKGN